MTPNQPYMIRALYDWIIDNDMTPYVLVNAENEFTQVPRQYVDNGKIVLNLIPNAISNLELGNDHISFNARFSGKDTNVVFPVSSVLAIYAKENGQGMVFDEKGDETPPPEPEKPARPSLKIVK